MNKKINIRLNRSEVMEVISFYESCYDLDDPDNLDKKKLVSYLNKRLGAF
tara:strand:- start:772 stop:921 length:150 start_codon:yes stop_codon:yes gene_type:complete